MIRFIDTDQAPHRYGLNDLPADISRRELLYHFSLREEEKDFIRNTARLPAYRVALGIQLGAYRFIGRPQYELEKTPPAVVKFVAKEFGNQEDVSPFVYSGREKTRNEHSKKAREYLGLSLFPQADHQLLVDNLLQQSIDPGHIPDWIRSAEDYLRSNNYVLPSVEVLRRLVLSARHNGIERVMSRITSGLSAEHKALLDAILNSNNGDENCWNMLTDKNVYTVKPEKVSSILARVRTLRELPVVELNPGEADVLYLRYLAQQGMRMSEKQLRSLGPLRRYATMVVTLKELEIELTDVAFQMNDEILSGVFLRGETRSRKYLVKYRRLVVNVVGAFRTMTLTLNDPDLPPQEKIARIDAMVPRSKREDLFHATDVIDVPKGSEALYFASQGLQTIQKYLPDLLETFTIVSASSSDPVLEAVQYYSKTRQKGKRIGLDAPTDFVQEARWKRIVFDEDGKIRAGPWTLCLADKLRTSFRQGSLQIQGARQYRSLSSDLLPLSEWQEMEMEEDSRLPYTASAEACFSSLSRAVSDFSHKLGGWLEEENPPAKLDEKRKLHFTKLDKMEEPESAKELRRALQKKMPQRSLSEILSEVDSWVGYSQYFTRLSTGQSIREDEKSAGQALYALLLASACNIPLPKMAASPGVSLDLLEAIREDLMRPQTIQAVIASLVEFHSRLPLAQIWGGAETSSSDGQGFVTAGRPLGAFYNKRRFPPRKRGFIIYTHILDNYAPFYTQVIPSSAREATYVLDGLLYHGTSLMPREHYTDSHGATDIVFAMTYLLGFRLAPRLANVPDLSLWHGKGSDVDFQDIFTGRILLETISSEWETIGRIVATILSGKTPASQIIRKISALSRIHPLYKAFRALGRLVRTRHILEIAGDKLYRSRIMQGLNKGESKNWLTGDIRYAKGGVIREKDPQMLLSVASSLNLAVLSVAVWNTVHMQRTIRRLLKEGHNVSAEDLRFLSPFTHEHINLYGQFRFRSVPSLDYESNVREFEPLWDDSGK